MSLSTELLIAIKYLQAKKREALISVTAILSLLGIMLGVAALVVVISVMNGYRIELTSKLKGFNSDIIVTNYNPTQAIKKYNSLTQKIKTTTDVKNVFPIIESQGLISYDKNSRGIVVKAISMDKLKYYPVLQNSERNPKKIKKANGVLLGSNLAFNLRVRVGDIVKLVSPEFTSTIVGVIPNAKDFYVEGIFRSGLSEYDNIYAIIPLKIGQVFFNLPKSVNKFEVFTNGEIDIDQTSKQIRNNLKGKYLIRNWQNLNKSLFNALKTERTVMFVILTFIVIVAVFNIISGLTMLVTDKTKEISILRTIGFTKGSIMRIFLFCGAILGGIGTMLGVILGLLFALYIDDIKNFISDISGTNLFDPIIYYLEVLPSKVEVKDVVIITIVSLILSLLATIYPSYRASRIHPAQGVKHE
ncbi:MAG: lipoprotein-releasing ABC transporter permease subunit [Rickettsiales bacterium]|nr:lipoprotein-releasing ABC transporter permease subunit [Rickettsiales bacterium]